MILVVGSTGMVGGEICRRLAGGGAQVTVTSVEEYAERVLGKMPVTAG